MYDPAWWLCHPCHYWFSDLIGRHFSDVREWKIRRTILRQIIGGNHQLTYFGLDMTDEWQVQVQFVDGWDAKNCTGAEVTADSRIPSLLCCQSPEDQPAWYYAGGQSYGIHNRDHCQQLDCCTDRWTRSVRWMIWLLSMHGDGIQPNQLITIAFMANAQHI